MLYLILAKGSKYSTFHSVSNEWQATVFFYELFLLTIFLCSFLSIKCTPNQNCISSSDTINISMHFDIYPNSQAILQNHLQTNNHNKTN